jgi:hypothetical protein
MMASRSQGPDAVYCRVDYPVDLNAGCASVATVVRGPGTSDMKKEDRRL